MAPYLRHKRKLILKNKPDREGWKKESLAGLLMRAKANTPLDFILNKEAGDTNKAD